MLVISHRGNLQGPDLNLENNPKHIQNLLNKGLNVEIDVWYADSQYYLGHDAPIYQVSSDFVKQSSLWCHAKNLNAFMNLLNDKTICFWHQEDDYTLTSNDFIWTYPGKEVNIKCIIVDTTPTWREKNYNCAGVCTDYINL